MIQRSPSQPPRVLVTGGEGFLGTYLMAHGTRCGAAMTSFDDGSSVAASGGPSHVSREGGARFERGSVLDADAVDALVRDADAVFHLAARVGVRRILLDPLGTLDVNTVGTQNVLEACTRHRVPVLYTSSSEVYGHSLGNVFREDGPILLGPPEQSRWGYAVSKLHGELLGFALAAQRDLRFLAVRLFNVVGPGQRGDQGMVLPRFVRSALDGAPLVVHGPGTQRRTFIHARDVAAALWDLLDRHDDRSEVVNVGSTSPVSILELAELVRATARSASEISIVDAHAVMPSGFVEVNERLPVLDRLHRRVGVRSLTPLAEIVREMVAAMSADGIATSTGE